MLRTFVSFETVEKFSLIPTFIAWVLLCFYFLLFFFYLINILLRDSSSRVSYTICWISDLLSLSIVSSISSLASTFQDVIYYSSASVFSLWFASLLVSLALITETLCSFVLSQFVPFHVDLIFYIVGTFKRRYYGHRYDFNHRKQRSSTCLSKYMSDLQDQGISYAWTGKSLPGGGGSTPPHNLAKHAWRKNIS
jgi:hypothetical protein